MATTITLPELGEGIESADVVSVLVAAGDGLEQDQPVVEVETDKAAVEVPSPITGTVSEVHVKPGDTLAVGDAIATVDAESQQTARSGAEARPAAEASETEAVPEIIEATGSKTERVEHSADGSSPPAAEEPPEETLHQRPVATPKAGPPAPAEPRLLVPAAPAVRRFAREVGVDINSVPGSGPGGRISEEDVKAHARRLLTGAAAAPLAGATPVLPDMGRWGEVFSEPMSKIRRVTAEQMARAWTTVPQVTHHDLADITELEEQRGRLKARVEATGGSLTVTAIAVKAAAAALKVHPKLNASIDTGNSQIIYKRYVHIGVAVDTEHGLLVPVIRNADSKSISSIARELDDLAKRARQRDLKPDEMQGASFTVSNLGGIGGTSFSPIVNWPQVAILGISRSRQETVWQNGGPQPRLMLPLALSYDHRLIDGAEAARFTRWLAEALEQPLLLVLEG